VVSEAIMLEVVFGLVVLVQLVLGVESAAQTAAVDFLLVDSANGSGTLLSPLLDFALSADG
jgi:hypothetical protein